MCVSAAWPMRAVRNRDILMMCNCLASDGRVESGEENDWGVAWIGTPGNLEQGVNERRLAGEQVETGTVSVVSRGLFGNLWPCAGGDHR